MKISIYRLAFLLVIIGGIATALMAGSPFMVSSETNAVTPIFGSVGNLPASDFLFVDTHKDTTVSVAINNKADYSVVVNITPKAFGRLPSSQIRLEVWPTQTMNAERYDVSIGAKDPNSSAIVYSTTWDFTFETLWSGADYKYDAYVIYTHPSFQN